MIWKKNDPEPNRPQEAREADNSPVNLIRHSFCAHCGARAQVARELPSGEVEFTCAAHA